MRAQPPLQLISLAGLLGCVGGPTPSPNSGHGHSTEPTPTTHASTPAPARAAGRWVPVPVETQANFRGVSAASSTLVWASGSEGTILRSSDAGHTWELRRIEGALERDFRDIHAFDERQAVALAAGSPALIYRTEDAGRSWTRSYFDEHPELFFDCMDFWDAEQGLAMSDPIDGRFYLLRTRDGGRSWTPLPEQQRPEALPGEAGFAASGTCLRVDTDGRAWFVSGGAAARVFISEDYGESWSTAATPIAAGEGTGIFSLAISASGLALAVGGDYRDEALAQTNLALSTDRGHSWALPAPGVALGGFREVVAERPGSHGEEWWALGPSGFDRSLDGGRSWSTTALEPRYHSFAFGPEGHAAWAVGAEGAVARWVTP